MEQGDASPGGGLASLGGYDRARDLLGSLNRTILPLLPQDILEEVAGHCGLALSDLSDLGCDAVHLAIVEAALYGWPCDGPSLAEVFLAGPEAGDLDEDERRLLEAVVGARLRLFQLIAQGPGLQVEIADAATLRHSMLWDDNLASEEALCGEWVVARIFEVDGEWMTSGALLHLGELAIEDPTLPEEEQWIDPMFELASEAERAGPTRRESEIDLLMEAVGEHLDAFHDVPDIAEEFVPDEGPAPLRVLPKPGRNEPCPCGSGKKYKHCCGN